MEYGCGDNYATKLVPNTCTNACIISFPLFCCLMYMYTQFSHVLLFFWFLERCFWNGIVGLSFAVFYQLSLFNRDVSKWQTGNVATMANSKCIISASVSVLFNTCTTTQFHLITISHTTVIFVVVETVLFLLHLFFASVFRGASTFNQDVSKWKIGAVTDMSYSKCTLSPSLLPRFQLLCFLIRHLSSFI